MPHARAADGTRIHYRVIGARAGDPVLMIQGLGTDSRGWIRQRFALGRRYRCILFDNRGVGHSDRPPGPYDLEVMADDALAVLDAAGYESAHVMGASMGGIIAQILAVRRPERVRSLVLACTGCHHLPWRRELLAEWAEIARTDGMSALSGRAAKWLVGPRSHRRLWPAWGILGSMALNAPAESFVAQIDAILGLDDEMRFELAGVRAPTLVLVGSQDILTPVGDSEEIASLVPDARLVVVQGAAHGFLFEQAGAFNGEVLRFLDEVGAHEKPSATTSTMRRPVSSGPTS
jgi:3-oxoadipate enol-lactonase